MHPHFVLVVALLPAYARLAVATVVHHDKVEVLSGEGCSMQCTAVQQPGVQYVAVWWYRVIGESKYGLITKRLPSGATRRYADVDRRVNLVNDSLAVSLPSVTCSSAGEYVCHLLAPVGEQNRDGHVQLSVTDCPVVSRENGGVNVYLHPVVASLVMILALCLFCASYVCLEKTLKRRNKRLQKAALLKAPFKPLSKEDLMLIYTLGPKTCLPKHLYV